MAIQNINPIYGKSFVGIWKRMFVSGRPEEEFRPLIFNLNGSTFGPIGPGSKIGKGTVIEITPDPNSTEKGTLKIKFNQRILIWSYTLNRNNAFKREFHPVPGSNRKPPIFNELLIVGEGVRQLYAFFSHPFRPVVTDHDVREMAF